MSLSFLSVWLIMLGALWGASLLARRSGKRDIAIAWSSFAWLIVGVGMARFVLWEPMKVNGTSMAPTLANAQTIVVNKHAFGLQLPLLPWRFGSSSPNVGDVVVFKSPQGDSWIKRVAAGPGQQILYVPSVGWFSNGVFLSSDNRHNVGNTTYPQWMESLVHTKVKVGKHEGWMITIPSSRYFLLGDNFSNSIDSRNIGPVRENYIAGRVDP